jgi:acyl carrier protein
VSAVLVFLILALGGQTGARVILEYVALFLILVGLILGVIALAGIRKHGTKGILAPALVGIAINGLLLFIFVSNFMAARARAQRVATPSPSMIVDRVRAEVAAILKKKSSQIDVKEPLVAQGADELDIVEIVMAVEEAFNAEIPDSAIGEKVGEASKDLTVEKLAEIVSRQPKRR